MLKNNNVKQLAENEQFAKQFQSIFSLPVLVSFLCSVPHQHVEVPYSECYHFDSNNRNSIILQEVTLILSEEKQHRHVIACGIS